MMKHYGARRNKKNKKYYRIVFDFRSKLYYVQFRGVAEYSYGLVPKWILLCFFEQYVEARELLKTMLNLTS